jgi:MFS family permease
MVGNVDLLLAARVVEGLGFITVVVAIPTLLLRIAAPRDQRLAMAFWATYMPAGAGSMMLVAALVLPDTSWRWAWWIAGGASAAMLLAPAADACGDGSSIPIADDAASGAGRDGGGREQRRAARDCGLLRRLFLLLVRGDRLSADAAGRALGMLDLDGGDRHGDRAPS